MQKAVSPITLGTNNGLYPLVAENVSTHVCRTFWVRGTCGESWFKPGGIVEPGVEYYAVLTDAEKAANVKAWEKNTGLKFKNVIEKWTRTKIKSGKTKGTAETAALKGSLEKSVWLKDYTYDALLKDLQAGKTKSQIANELYEKNPEFFEKLRKTRGVRDNALNTMRTALFDRLIKKPELLKLHNLNEKNFLAKEKLALKEVKNFVKKNQEAYKKVYASNKIGAVTNFKEKVLDFISKKYPELITRSEGTVNLLAGQRLFTPYRLLGREVTQQGRYGLDIALNKEIRKALNIPERPLAGEGLTTDRLHRNYNKNLTKLIKIARDKNIIPKWIKTETQYANYIQKTQIDPIRNLFGKRFNFGQEHLGGVSRAVLVNDAESLAKVTAMDPVVNRYVKGVGYDTRIANLVRLAKQSSGDQAKLYKDSANKLIAEADKKFGLDQTKLKIVKDELKTIQPKASLEDSLYKKAQRALKTFVATKRFKEPNFKLLPEELKKAINFLKEGNVLKSNAFLKAAIRNAPRILSKFALAEGTILEDVFKKQAEGKTVLESVASPFFLDKAVHKGLKRSKADDQQNLAYDRANLLRFVQEGKADISNIVHMATKDPDFDGRPGEYIEWLKVVVADPHQQKLIRERDIQTEEALTLPAEKVAERSERYKSWKSIPAVEAVTEMFKSDEQKAQDLENLLNV